MKPFQKPKLQRSNKIKDKDLQGETKPNIQDIALYLYAIFKCLMNKKLKLKFSQILMQRSFTYCYLLFPSPSCSQEKFQEQESMYKSPLQSKKKKVKRKDGFNKHKSQNYSNESAKTS